MHDLIRFTEVFPLKTTNSLRGVAPIEGSSSLIGGMK